MEEGIRVVAAPQAPLQTHQDHVLLLALLLWPLRAPARPRTLGQTGTRNGHASSQTHMLMTDREQIGGVAQNVVLMMDRRRFFVCVLSKTLC
jgi:hypothetical protein